jgi:multidrug efflux system membrane fusion protein
MNMIKMPSSIRDLIAQYRGTLGSPNQVIEFARHLLLTRRRLVLGVAAALVVLVGIVILRGLGNQQGAVAQGPGGGRGVPVDVVKAVKTRVPFRLEALGTVTTMASVAIKARVDSEIVKVHFADGAKVKEGDILFTLDSRSIEAQIRQAEGNIARSQAQLDGAERDVRRYTDLVAKGATPTINLDNSTTQADIFRAAIKADQAALDNLKVLMSYCVIRAPISGRVGSAAVKVGNFVRQADAVPLATINQIAPIYVNFAVPQRSLPDVRRALAAETATLEAIVPGESKRAGGQVTVIDNAVDSTTGMVMIRATMPNAEELLWPGMLVTAQMTLRVEQAVVVPTTAVQVSQTGTFVFVIKGGAATVQPVHVARTFGNQSVIEDGLQGDEVVVVNGQLLLSNGTKVAPREVTVGS